MRIVQQQQVVHRVSGGSSTHLKRRRRRGDENRMGVAQRPITTVAAYVALIFIFPPSFPACLPACLIYRCGLCFSCCCCYFALCVFALLLLSLHAIGMLLLLHHRIASRNAMEGSTPCPATFIRALNSSPFSSSSLHLLHHATMQRDAHERSDDDDAPCLE